MAATTAEGTAPSAAPRPHTYPVRKFSPRSASAALVARDQTACIAIGSSASRSRRAGVAAATTSGVATSGGGGV